MNSRMTEQITRLKRLVADLERLDAGIISAPSLMAMPVLGNWAHSFRRVPCLEGNVEGHPSLPDRSVIVTSELYAHFRQDDEQFVRTLSRWYRLGAPGQRTRSHGGSMDTVLGGLADENS
jgi:hypothetical protein